MLRAHVPNASGFCTCPRRFCETVGACRMRRATVAGFSNAVRRMPQPYGRPRVPRAHFLRFPPTSARSRPAPALAGPRPAPTSSDQFRPVPDRFRPVPTNSDQSPTSPRPAPDQPPTSSDQSRPVPTSPRPGPGHSPTDSDQFRPVTTSSDQSPTSPGRPRPASAGFGRRFRPVLPVPSKSRRQCRSLQFPRANRLRRLVVERQMCGTGCKSEKVCAHVVRSEERRVRTLHGFRLADRTRLEPFAYARDGFASLRQT